PQKVRELEPLLPIQALASSPLFVPGVQSGGTDGSNERRKREGVRGPQTGRALGTVMRSRTVHLPAGRSREALLAACEEAGRPPDVVLALLSPDQHLRETLGTLTAIWPDALRFG